MKEKSIITKDMTIQEVIEKVPGSVNVLMNYGFHCIGCHIASVETIEEGIKAHGLKDSDLKKMLKEINDLR
ncbi:MAG: DUF1858 domain-containing protein [archaeon]